MKNEKQKVGKEDINILHGFDFLDRRIHINMDYSQLNLKFSAIQKIYMFTNHNIDILKQKI